MTNLQEKKAYYNCNSSGISNIDQILLSSETWYTFTLTYKKQMEM